MGIDWEEILGAEGDDIQGAHDESVAQADRYDADNRRLEEAERRRHRQHAMSRSTSGSPRPTPQRTPIAYRSEHDAPPFLEAGDIVLKPGQEMSAGYRAG